MTAFPEASVVHWRTGKPASSRPVRVEDDGRNVLARVHSGVEGWIDPFEVDTDRAYVWLATTIDGEEVRRIHWAVNAATMLAATGPRGPQGEQGKAGPPGPEYEDFDEAVATEVDTPGSRTRTAIGGLLTPVVDDAIGAWWTYPQAVAAPNPERIYVSGTSSGDGEEADLVVAEVTLATGRVRRHAVGKGTVDDHNAPAVSVAPGSRTLVVWSERNFAHTLRYRVSGRSGDIASLGPESWVNVGRSTTYARIHRLPNPDEFIAFFRGNLGGQYRWAMARGTITTDGNVSWGTTRDIVAFAQPNPPNNGDQGYMTTAQINPSRIRFAVYGHPTTGALRSVHYGEIDLTTGAITSPGTSVGANAFTGDGLPLSPEDLAQAYMPPAGHTVRLFDVAQGEGNPAVAIAEWPEGSPSQAEYKHVELESTVAPGLHVGSGGYAATPYVPGMNGDHYSFRWFGQWDAIQTQILAFRMDPSGERAWALSMIPTGAIRLTRWPTGAGSPSSVVDSTTVVTIAGEPIGIRVDHDAPAGQTTFYTSTDDGQTWDQLGDVRSQPPNAPFHTTSTALHVPGGQNSGFTGMVRRFQMIVDSTVVVDEDFASGSTDWTLHGQATIVGSGWGVTDLGPTGAAIAPTVSTYLGGASFQDADRILTSSTDGTTRRLTRHVKAGAEFVSEVLAEGPHPVGPWRPQPIVGASSWDATYSDVSAYGAGFGAYQAQIKGV